VPAVDRVTASAYVPIVADPFYVPRDRLRALDDERRRLMDELVDPALGLDRRAVVLRRLDEIGLERLESLETE
jgi:hypothetical protein